MPRKTDAYVTIGADIEPLKKGLNDAGKSMDSAGKNMQKATGEMATAFKSAFGGNFTGKLKQGIADLNKEIAEQKQITLEFQKELNALQNKLAQTSPTNLAAVRNLKQSMSGLNVAIKDQRLGVSELTQKKAALTQELTKVNKAQRESFFSMDRWEKSARSLVPSVSSITQGLVGFSAGIVIIEGLKNGISLLADSFAKATTAQQAMSMVSEKAFDNSIKERVGVIALRDVINSETTSETQKLAAKQALIDQFPEYYGNLNAATSKTEDFNSAIAAQIQLLDKQAQAQAAQEMYVEVLKKFKKAQSEFIRDSQKKGGGRGGFDMSMALGIDQRNLDKMNSEVLEFKKIYENFNREVLAIEADAKKFGKTPKEKKTKAPVTKEDVIVIDEAGYVSQVWREELERIGNIQPIVSGGQNQLTKGMDELQLATHESTIRFAEHRKELDKIKLSAEDLTAFIQSQLISAIDKMASALGEAAATGANLAQALGNAFLESMADFIKTFGKMLVAAGVSRIIIDTGLAVPGGGPAAIAAGAAMIAIGAGIQAHLKKGPAKMAEGGIVPPGFPNDTFPALLTSGETVTPKPLPRLQSGTPEWKTVFTGRQLLVMLDQAEKDYNR